MSVELKKKKQNVTGNDILGHFPMEDGFFTEILLTVPRFVLFIYSLSELFLFVISFLISLVIFNSAGLYGHMPL